MPGPRPRRRLATLLAAVILAIGLVFLLVHTRVAEPAEPGEKPKLALFTSLPLFWAEAPDLATMLRDDRPPHWARGALERRYVVAPLDTLEPGPGGLDGTERLALIQPRPLSPSENVALDRWVREGGSLLLFADPALTEDSSFAMGDKRRPQDIAMLSPILSRWGLKLMFDDEQPLGLHDVGVGAARLPVNLPGHFVLSPGGGEGRCALAEGGLVASCSIGRGRVLAVADAALFETAPDEADRATRSRALFPLLDRAFGADPAS